MLNQPILGIGKVPRCTSFNGVPCLSLRYAIDSADPVDMDNAHALIGFVREGARAFSIAALSPLLTDRAIIDNGLEESDIEFVGTEAALVAHFVNQPNTTQLGLVFYQASNYSYSYNIYFNASYNVLDVLDIRRKPDGRNEVRCHAGAIKRSGSPPWARASCKCPWTRRSSGMRPA